MSGPGGATQVANYSLVLEYKGSNTALTPFALLSHYDVVPADASAWSVPPFGGVVKDGWAPAFAPARACTSGSCLASFARINERSCCDVTL